MIHFSLIKKPTKTRERSLTLKKNAEILHNVNIQKFRELKEYPSQIFLKQYSNARLQPVIEHFFKIE